MTRKIALAASAVTLLASLALWSQRERIVPPPDAKPGPVDGGGFLLPSGWTVRPAGRQAPLDTLPLAARLLDDGKTLLVLQSGYRTPSLSLHDAKTGALKTKVPLKDSFHGVVVQGNAIYAGGGATGAVYEFRAEGGELKPG